MGNLADELEMMDDFEEEDATETVLEEQEEESAVNGVDGARDSGIDVSYENKRSSATGRLRSHSKPIASSPAKPPESEGTVAEDEDKLSRELEELISSVARMASYASTSEDPLIPRFIPLLQDLGNQSALENSTQRLTTSTNSMTTHLTAQSKSIQNLITTLYSPLALLTAPLPPNLLAETLPLLETLLTSLPLPDPTALHGIQKLVRDTEGVTQTLSQLTDTLQMGKHVTNSAARHLRDSQRMVAGMRRQREKAEEARAWLQAGEWDRRVAERWCATECRDVVSGFERRCEELREGIVRAAG